MAGVDITGFIRKTEDELFEETIAEARATVDPDFDDSPDSATGQLTGIVASKWAELWEVLEEIHNTLGPNASGANLDRIAAWTNTFRNNGESDATFRLRRRQEASGNGLTTDDAMQAALSRLPGMTDARVVSNRTMLTIDGRPPKSVEALVLGTSTTAEIAAAVWKHLTSGIEAHGTTTTNITDSEGNLQTVRFTRPAPAMPTMRIVLKVDHNVFPGEFAVKERIVDFTNGAIAVDTTDGASIAGLVPIGGTIYRSRISAAAQTVAGVVAVTAVEFLVNVSFTSMDWALGPREYLGASGVRGFDNDHVLVSVT